MVILVRVPSMGQIELFNHLLRTIVISYSKLYSSEKKYLYEIVILND